MPCDSRVTRTKMTDSGKLAEALKALGYEVTGDTHNVRGVKGTDVIEFSRRQTTEAFLSFNINTNAINGIQRKYSEIGVRQWAKKNGYSIASTDGRKFQLVNRRG